MSLVYITTHNENIYDLRKKQKEEIFKPPKYVSKQHAAILKREIDMKNISSTKKLIASTKCDNSLHRTMGYPNTTLKNPCEFLRKNEGIKWCKNKAHICGEFPKLAAVPKASEIRKSAPRDIKNFIHVNVSKAKSAKTNRPKPKFVDTRYGETHLLCNAGIMPAYIFQPNFGKTPKYLKKYIENKLENEKKDVKEKDETGQDYTKMDGFVVLGADYRIKLLGGLKGNWLEKHKIFQTLPVLTDTIPKIYHKSKIENELRQLEQDILLIENNPQIYICE